MSPLACPRPGAPPIIPQGLSSDARPQPPAARWRGAGVWGAWRRVCSRAEVACEPCPLPGLVTRGVGEAGGGWWHVRWVHPGLLGSGPSSRAALARLPLLASLLRGLRLAPRAWGSGPSSLLPGSRSLGSGGARLPAGRCGEQVRRSWGLLPPPSSDKCPVPGLNLGRG